MLRKTLLAVTSALLFLSPFEMARAQVAAPARPAAQQPAYEVPFVSKKLANGLEVIVYPDSGVPLVTVELVVRNGSFTEPPELNGLSHLYEHMFFKPNLAVRLAACENGAGSGPGCTEALRLKSQIGDTSFLRNSSELNFFNGSTREEVVNYFYTTTSPYLASAISLINTSVRFPTFDPEEFESEKRVVIGELDRHEANPLGYLSQAMTERLFFKYPSRKSPAGTRETVATATIEKMRTIQSRYYFPNNSALVVTGDTRPEEVFRLAEQIMGSWEPRKVDPFKDFPLVEHPPLPNSSGSIIEKVLEDDESHGGNAYLNIGWQGPSIGKDDAATYAADVFSYIITQPDSRFQRALVDTGLATSVNFGYYTQRNIGPINLVITTTPEKAKAALKAAYAEIARFDQPDYYTDEELASAKTILESNDLFEREKLSDYSHTLGFWWSSTGIEYFRGYHRNLRATTRADIERYVRTYIKGKPHVGIALISPDGQKRASLTEQDLIGAN